MRLVSHEIIRHHLKPDWRINALMWALCGFSFLAVVIVALAAWFRP